MALEINFYGSKECLLRTLDLFLKLNHNSQKIDQQVYTLLQKSLTFLRAFLTQVRSFFLRILYIEQGNLHLFV